MAIVYMCIAFNLLQVICDDATEIMENRQFPIVFALVFATATMIIPTMLRI